MIQEYVPTKKILESREKFKLKEEIRELKYLRFDLKKDLSDLRKELDLKNEELNKLNRSMRISKEIREARKTIETLKNSSVKDRAIELASKAAGVTVEQMNEKNRKAEVILARRFVYAYLRQLDLKTWSLSVLGRIFDQNHATVINALKKHGYQYGKEKYNDKTYTAMFDAYCISMDSLEAEIYE